MIRRFLPVVILVAIVVAVVLLVSGGGTSGDGYQVRAIFDNGAFMVPGEQVRVAGANVGTIESVSVSRPGEPVAYRDGKAVSVPGKAIMVLDIEDPGFQDFRKDASCQIRPQSLIGEKYVDCRPTLPRAPGSPTPPPLKKIESGPGEGQHLLPLGSNGTSVDPDLINDIQTLPYAQRFRLIFNELGAGLAGRGADIEDLVKRANPVLRDVDTLFGVLSAQRKQLAQLASDSEQILEPLSRQRAHVAGFLANSGTAAAASAEHGPELEAALQKFPRFLTEFKLTMTQLKGFSDAARPVFEELGSAAPALTDATRTLTPFSQASTVALKSLGKAGEEAGPLFAEADPVVRNAATLAKAGVQPTDELAKLLTNLQATGGWGALTELIYNTSAVINGFDQYGHFARTRFKLSTCLEYSGRAAGSEGGGCTARFNGPGAPEGDETEAEASTSATDLIQLLLDKIEAGNAEVSGGTPAGEGPAIGIGQAGSTEGGDAEEAPEGRVELGEASATTRGTEPLLDYLLGP
jgi:phospholipid/cholesterol/gamma-HCH transport system substrate-binding protein